MVAMTLVSGRLVWLLMKKSMYRDNYQQIWSHTYIVVSLLALFSPLYSVYVREQYRDKVKEFEWEDLC